MKRVLLALSGVIVTFLVAMVWVGSTEPSRTLSREGPLWFAAVAGPGTVEPSEGVTLRWASRAELTLVGDDAPLFDRYLLFSGTASGSPVTFGPEVTDAWLVRLEPQRVPLLVLGYLRLLHLTGVTQRREDQPEALERFGLETRADTAILPSLRAIEGLMNKPRSFRPAMVNFLAYSDEAAYQRYGTVAVQTVYGLGGQLQFAGTVAEVLRASTRDRGAPWNSVAAMRYPDPTAIFTMEQDDAYRASLEDRSRGLARTRVIATKVEDTR